jgi:hypothetical protein
MRVSSWLDARPAVEMAWVPGDLAPAPVRAVSGRSGAGWPNSSPRLVSVHPLPASPAHPTRLLLAGSAAPTLMATPAGLTVDHSRLGFAWQAALPRDGDGQGNGGGQAKGRYGDALEPRSHAAPRFPQASRKQHGPNLDRGRAYGLAPNETQALIERGWKGPKTQDRFKNHGQRTRTTVELTKRLGYSTRVGALQANFGIPFENGVTDLQDQLAEARAARGRTPRRGARSRHRRGQARQGSGQFLGNRRSGRQRRRHG